MSLNFVIKISGFLRKIRNTIRMNQKVFAKIRSIDFLELCIVGCIYDDLYYTCIITAEALKFQLIFLQTEHIAVSISAMQWLQLLPCVYLVLILKCRALWLIIIGYCIGRTLISNVSNLQHSFECFNYRSSMQENLEVFLLKSGSIYKS